jgi:hypothetical protein
MSEERLGVYPNEMLARLWADILEQEGIGSFVKPELGGYGPLGHNSFIPHSLFVLSEHIVRGRAIIVESSGLESESENESAENADA